MSSKIVLFEKNEIKKQIGKSELKVEFFSLFSGKMSSKPILSRKNG
jgi:hypothetical protein